MLRINNQIGIMQGRLSPGIEGKVQAFPWESWEIEFFRAKEIGLDLIDWIVEDDKFYENPLLTVKGEKRIKELKVKTGIFIGAVNAYYFVNRPLLKCSPLELKQSLSILELLINRLNYFGIKFLELPFLDNSAIKDKMELQKIIQIIKPILDRAYQMQVTLAFETSLPADMFRNFLSDLNHPAARVNYDMGNSASLGYNPKEELESYGELVATVHVKDRLLKGRTVPLGQGNTDFATCFSMLKTKNYTGPFILEAVRAENEIEAAKGNTNFVKNYLSN